MEIIKKKTGNPTIIQVGPEFTRKKANNCFQEYQNIKKYYSELFCFMDENSLVTKTIHGVNGYDSGNEKAIAKWLFDLHQRGVAQGDFSPTDTLTDENGKVWVVDWADAHTGIQFIDVLDYVFKKHWGKWNAKQFKKSFVKDSFFLAYLDLCFKLLGERKIAKLKKDYLSEQPEQKYFEELL